LPPPIGERACPPETSAGQGCPAAHGSRHASATRHALANVLGEHNSSLTETGINRFLSTIKTTKQLPELQPDYPFSELM
jgi:hypothetical protein